MNGATNQLSGAGYDLNGNMTTGTGVTLGYDEANRVASATPVSGGTEYYAYAPDNKRIYKLKADGTESWTFYGARGEKLLTDLQVAQPGQIYTPQGNPTGQWAFAFAGGKSSVWFGGRLISEAGTYGGMGSAVYQDRLGTNRAGGAKFYPYGEEAGTGTANDRTKFGTYNRDGFTGLDYADQRYYASSYGRFNTPDPYRASGGPADPGSWNRYSYVGGDPINFYDPQGLVRWNPFAGMGGVEGSCSNWWLQAQCGGPTATQDRNGDNGGAAGGGGNARELNGASVAQQALSSFSTIAFSPECEDFVDGALGAGTLAGAQAKAVNTSLYDASLVNDTEGSALFPNSAELAAAEQARADASTGHSGTTVAQAFDASPTRLAQGQYGGSSIFYSASWFSTLGSGTALYTIFHEMLHLSAVFGDAQIEKAFGIPASDVKSLGSTSITYKLMEKCGH